jgi:uncharacterized protein YndB with AHSA1/START domain
MKRAIIAALALLGSASTQAEVKEASEAGFTVSHVKTVPASPDKVWAALVEPGRWWSPAHSWSGDAKNFSLDPRAGGCFCERWSAGEVEHGRVVFAVKGQMLRVRGALGPLQSEAVTGTLTFTLKPEGTGTRISVDYVVGGHARFAMKDVASGVDGVIGEQVAALAKLLGG